MEATISLWFLLLLFPLLLIFILSFIVSPPRPVKVPIKGRHVFITGGSSGIGLELAKQAAMEGARVSILARNREKLEEAKESIRLSTLVDVAIFSADVRDMEAVTKAIDEAGPIDVLICNHGVFVARELDKQDLEEVKYIIDVNLLGTFHLIKAALPGMKARKEKLPASIAIMSSQVGQIGIYGYTAYSSTKFGLRGMAEALRQELIVDNIHLSLIYPPDTDTPGLVEDSKRRPALTRIIAASSNAMKAHDIAKISWEGIKSGKYNVSCNFKGWMLGVICSGCSPQRSYIVTFVDVLSIGILHLIAMCYQWKFYRTILKWHAQNNTH